MSTQESRLQSDPEILVAALEEAQRLLVAQAELDRRYGLDDVLAMLEFVICDPAVKQAMIRQKMRAQVKLVV